MPIHYFIGMAVFTAIFAIAVRAALRKQDLAAFEQVRKANSRHYRNLVWTCRCNGPLVALLCLAGLLVSPFAIMAEDGGVLFAAFIFINSLLGLWLAIHWTRWGWSVRFRT